MELKFKEKFPELNENQIKMLEREILELVGPDVASDSHVTRDYNRADQDRDLVNRYKRVIRARIKHYIHNQKPIDHKDK